jgi:hypothetical protein
MKNFLLLSALGFFMARTASAQYSNSTGDVVIPGSNAWTLHTPDDGRTSLYLAPWVNGTWSWGTETEFYSNGNVRFTGKILIGNRIPQTQTDYSLAVEGKIVGQSLYVTAPSNWADFVFAPNYKCMPLPELEAYLTTNKHLPLIPAASQVEANGYSVAEMDAKLLQTIEELTLQVIKLGKEVEQLKAARPVGSK